MKKIIKPRLVMLLAVVCLGAVFFFPLWQITLEAAQFPDPLKLYIWIDKIAGNEKGTLQDVNILNHYIGMQAIEPDSIPELQYFPIIAYIMIGLGLLCIWLNKAWGYLGWFIIMVILGGLAIYDFYLWLYDYGHNLDPEAAIKIPGYSFMPPLLGDRDMLNFYVQSYPHWGSVFIGFSTLLSGLAFIRKKYF